MSIFIEVLNDEELQRVTANYSTILVIGCRECTNYSLAYQTDGRLSYRQYDKGIDYWEPYAAVNELNRIKTLLHKNGKNVKVELEMPCLLTDQKDIRKSEERTDISAILCVCCMAGKIGILKTVGDTVPVLLGANTVGILQCHIDNNEDYRFVNKQKSTLIRFDGEVPDNISLDSYWDHVNNKE